MTTAGAAALPCGRTALEILEPMVVEMACELDNIESSRKHTYMEVMGVERLTQEEADDWKRGGAALWQPCGADSHWLNRSDCTITTQDRIPAAEEAINYT